GFAHVSFQTNMAGQLIPAGHLTQVRENFGLPREAVRPAGVGRERVRVDVRRDVAHTAGVAVVAPGAADRTGPLQEDEVGPARLEQPDAGPDASEAGADDGDPYGAGQRFGLADGGLARARMPPRGNRELKCTGSTPTGRARPATPGYPWLGELSGWLRPRRNRDRYLKNGMSWQVGRARIPRAGQPGRRFRMSGAGQRRRRPGMSRAGRLGRRP